jgi:diguanylate cyclase (GGDEF)-like protein
VEYQRDSPEDLAPRAPAALSGLAQLRDRYFRAIEPLIPADRLAAGGESLRSARIVVSFTLVLLLLAGETWVFFHWALPDDATLLLDAALVVGLGLTLFVRRALEREDAPELAANLVVTGAFLVIVTVFSLIGGIRAPVLHWCALVPMLAVLMGARRSAWLWGALAMTTLAGFAWVETQGIAVPSYLEASGLVGDRLWIQRIVDVGSWILILLAVAVLYERYKDQQTAELGSTNSELTRQIAQRRRAEQRTHYLAYYDELTELPNRQLFQEQLESAMAQADRDGRLVAVMFLDLDGFKEVNDSYGHRLGDALLQQVAERLRSCVRNADAVFRGDTQSGDVMVSRLGGDEFTVLLVRLRSVHEAEIVARRVLGSFDPVFPVEGHELHISASIGVALYPGEVGDVGSLLKSADLAMYSAKARGKNNYQFFTESMNDEIVHRTTLASELRRAQERDEFVVHYQPIVRAHDREIVALEALIRWQHPERGLLLPGEFIGIAEETGLIVPIAERVLYEVCRQYCAWRDAGLPCVRMAVNLSGVQLRYAGLAGEVARVIDETGMDARQLELEITENAVMEDEAMAAMTLMELKQLGVQIALDDFGTGYSSLSYVQRYPVDTLKVDRSFVRNVDSDPHAQTITTAIVAMAHGLQLTVVAEGVETEAQELFLNGLGCDHLQGFRFSIPRPAHEIAGLLEAGISPEDFVAS